MYAVTPFNLHLHKISLGLTICTTCYSFDDDDDDDYEDDEDDKDDDVYGDDDDSVK